MVISMSQVIGQDQAMTIHHHRPWKYALFGLLGICATVVEATPFDDLFTTAGSREWVELSGTNLSGVAPVPQPTGTTGVWAVMSKWSGGAYDTDRDRLIIWGGGHFAYAGNEVYVFDVNNMEWIRLTDPTADAYLTQGIDPYRDGNPISRHTYDALAYIPAPYDLLYGRGGGVYVTGYATPLTWLFDFKSNSWHQGADHPNTGNAGEISDYDFVTQRVYSYDKNYLVAFDPATESWTQISTHKSSSFQPLGGNGVVDPIRRKFIRVGRGVVNVQDLDVIPSTAQAVITTGATEIVNTESPGLVYDPVSDKLVAWNGGDASGAVYLLDLDTLVWEKIVPTGSVAPYVLSSGEFNGTYGRFQYMPSKNGFIAVNYTDSNVYVFKLNNAPPMSPSSRPGALSITTR